MMRGPEMMPNLAALPTTDYVIAGALALGAVTFAVGMIIRSNRETRRLRNQGFSENQMPRMLQLRHRDRHDIPTDDNLSEFR